MESIFHKRNWKKEKGLTLTETVVALSITTIVSVAVVSLSIYTSNSLYRERAKDFFIYETQNIVTMYFDYSESNYEKAFEYMTGTDISGYQDVTIYYHDDFTYGNETDYSYYLDVKFLEDNLSFASYNKKGASMYERSVAR